MADDKLKRTPADATRINVHEDYELRYWSEKFGCSHAQLEAAVKAVGTNAVTVGEHLKAAR